jgi:hypothetical protein
MNSNNMTVTARASAAQEKIPDAKVAAQAWQRRELLTFAVGAVALAVGYAWFTDHVWEDYFITFRHSRNLTEGHGLVYHIGERVHGFTSPLGTLLPALFYWIIGKESYVPALWVFRAVSILAFAGGGLLVLKAFQNEDNGGNRLARLFFALLYLLEIKTVSFSTNGMETGFMLLFVGWGIFLAMKGVRAGWLPLGLCWAGLMWTRPDGCIYIAALAGFAAVFAKDSWRQYRGVMLKAAVACAILYLPWFGWAWWYYGSPVPHTVIGKSNVMQGPWFHLGTVLGDLFSRFFNTARLCFLPIYPDADYNNFHPGMLPVATCLAVFAAVYWVFPTADRLGRFASACFVVLCLYLSYPQLYPWYLGPVAMFGFVAIARGPAGLAAAFQGQHARWRTVAFGVLGAVLVERGLLFSQSVIQLKIQQLEIETGTRERIGEWLKANGRAEDRIFLEPMGYIGYFSNMRIADTAGLVCPEIVELRRKGVLLPGKQILALRPEWAVLRPKDVELFSHYPKPPEDFNDEFAKQYRLVKAFDATTRLGRYGFIPGSGYLKFDSVFLIYRRADLPPLTGDSADRLRFLPPRLLVENAR